MGMNKIDVSTTQLSADLKAKKFNSFTLPLTSPLLPLPNFWQFLYLIPQLETMPTGPAVKANWVSWSVLLRLSPPPLHLPTLSVTSVLLVYQG